MIRGLYTAASGMITQQQRQDTLTNNLANIDTPGFKAKQGMIRAFPEVLINAIRLTNNVPNVVGPLHQGVFIEENVPVFSQGDLIDTGTATHMAILDKDLEVNPETGKKPALFFTLEDENGNRFYTRSGLFTVDAAGQLVTPEGYLVLDDFWFPIEVNGRSFTIDDKGNIAFEDGENVKVGLTVIDDTSLLENKGNQMYLFTGDEETLGYVDDNAKYNLYQGKIERANVDPAQTMIDMTTALRLYEANQTVIQSIDQTLQKAVNEIGRI